jgi:hypothetical protein
MSLVPSLSDPEFVSYPLTNKKAHSKIRTLD